MKDIYEKWHGIYTLNWHTGGHHTLPEQFTLLTLTLLTDIGYPFRFFFKEKPRITLDFPQFQCYSVTLDKVNFKKWTFHSYWPASQPAHALV